MREKLFIAAGQTEDEWLHHWKNQLQRPGTGAPGIVSLVESFVLLDPHRVLSARAIPYWTVFNTDSSYQQASNFLKRKDGAIDDILVLLFPHGVESVGQIPVDLGRYARENFYLIGIDRNAYPRDFGAFIRYHRELWRHAGRRKDARAPSPVSIDSLLSFIEQRQGSAVTLA